MLLGREVGLGLSHILLDPAPLPEKEGRAPNFQPTSIVAKRLDGPRWHLSSCHGGGPRSRPHCARWGPNSPSLKSHSPNFGPFLLCQTVGCIKMPLGTEVGLCRGHIALDGVPAQPPQKGDRALIFGLCPFWPNGCVD